MTRRSTRCMHVFIASRWSRASWPCSSRASAPPSSGAEPHAGAQRPQVVVPRVPHGAPSLLFPRDLVMLARVKRIDSVDLYVTAVICVGAMCTAALFACDADELHLVLTPEVALFTLCALVGDFVPLKVFTRGAEGEVTTSTCFAVAAMLAAGPLAALIALLGTNLIADGLAREA